MLGFKDLMESAANLQSKLADIQDGLARRTVIGSAGGDMVQVEMNGVLEVVSVKIEPALIADGDVEMLQDLVAAATNAAIARAKEMATAEMSKLTGGLRLPGMV
ncbi:MAG: YbaB/EbfC family nucleoid-associated protein [Desulfomonile sp.]|nr:YbaB/EbfC family nucleoid-associated protein [Desulfomonile sp.]